MPNRSHMYAAAGLVVVSCCLCAPLHGQNLTVTSALGGGGAPFIRSEMVMVELTGAEPFRPVTLFMGPPGGPLSVPGIAGTLQVDPAGIVPVGSLDGLGIFGAPQGFTTDATGGFSFPVLIPAGFPASGLPFDVRLQVVVLQDPSSSPGGEAFTFSNAAALTVDEPASSVQITEVSPSFINEGAPLPITVRASGLLDRATVVPRVTFTSDCSGASAEAQSVVLVQDSQGLALAVLPPDTVGGATAPPATNSGPVRIEVSYAAVGLYPNNPANGEDETAPSGFGDPTFLAYQTSLQPQVSGISPKGNLTSGGCTVTVTGSNFLDCAQVIFDAGASALPATNVTVVDTGTITCDPPAFPAPARVAVAVRNVDHVPTSPRQSPANPPATDFAYFTSVLSQVTVTGITPGTITEGTPGVTLTVTGTCPEVGGLHALDPAMGATGALLGAEIGGMTASTPLNVTAVTAPAPGMPAGTFELQADAPQFPPGLNPVGPSQNGLTNTGPKHVQVVAPPCLNAAQAPHLSFSAIAAQEPGNLVKYQAQDPPVVTGYVPNNVTREDGNQAVTLLGTGFLTQDVVVVGSDPSLGPQVDFLGNTTTPFSPEVPVMSVQMTSPTSLDVVTPDVTAMMLSLPFRSDVRVTNPGCRTSDTAGSADDFWFVPGLAGLVPNTFATTGSSQLLNTTPTGPGGQANVFTFPGDLVIPATLLLNATGEHPLIVRVRGNLLIEGTVDLSGASVSSGPFLHPSGGAPGGAPADLMNLGAEDAFQGMAGGSPIDPLTLLPYPNFGGGGFHAQEAGGGGAGGMDTAGAAGMPGIGSGGPGGQGYTFPSVPIPVLGAGNETEVRYPPGGSGGGAGGLGTTAPLNFALPPGDVGQNGGGGRGAGAVCFAVDGTITVTGSLILDGEDGGDGQPAANFPAQGGGGGGGGSGGAILLQAIQGVFVQGTAVLSAQEGAGGLAGVGMGSGGAGSQGRIRLAVPVQSADLSVTVVVDGGASLTPAPDPVLTY